LWKDLDAVKAGEVTEVSDDIWNTSGGVLSANQVLDELVDILK
jgi:iron complex transport system substrate-binding protein